MLQFNLDDKFRNFTRDTLQISKISAILTFESERFVKKEGDFIKVENDDFISFIPSSKLVSINDANESKYRTKMKIGRFIKKFLRKEAINLFNVKDSDIEFYVNIYKSYFNSNINEFKIVEGQEIKKWYLEDNYSTPNGLTPGTLWHSCMRYPEKNKFMSIYSNNPQQVKMLIHVDENDRLITRALLWESAVDKDGNSYKVMDRIYSIYDHEVESFKTWAKENGYIYKWEQSAKSERIFVVDGEPKKLDLKIKLENKQFNYYPYIDTFKYFDTVNGYLSNSGSFRWDYILVQNDGGLERIEEEPEPEYDEWYEDEQ